MRLLTHNLLICNVQACKETLGVTASHDDGGDVEMSAGSNFPLKIVAKEGGVEMIESEFNRDFIVNMIPKLDWGALVEAAKSLKVEGLPAEKPDGVEDDEDLLQVVQTALMDYHINEGELVCQHCGRSYPITNGIPNMLLREDEM